MKETAQKNRTKTSAPKGSPYNPSSSEKEAARNFLGEVNIKKYFKISKCVKEGHRLLSGDTLVSFKQARELSYGRVAW